MRIPSLRLTLRVKITGLVLLVVAFFSGYVALTTVKFGDVSRRIADSAEEVDQGQEELDGLLTALATSNDFDRQIVDMLVLQLTLSHLNKLYLATEDSGLVLEHEELLGRLEETVEAVAARDERLAALREPIAEYRRWFEVVDERLMEQDLDKARQVSVTALDAASKRVVEVLRQVLTESSQNLRGVIGEARETSNRSVASVTGLRNSAMGLRSTIRALAAVSVLLIAVSVGLAILVPRYVVRSLLRVIEAMREIARGNFTRTIAIRSKDEIGNLGRELNQMVETLRGTVRSIVAVSVDLAAVAEELSATTSQIATSNEEVGNQTQGAAAGATEMAATVEQVARSTQAVNQVSSQAQKAASEGGAVIAEALRAFEDIARVVGDAGETVNKLGQQSQKIGTVVEVIEDIADQTNLLALNAAIEAARAGEHGRGFAVVADEVRKLAEKTVRATREIAATVSAIQSDTRDATEAMGRGAEAVTAGAERAQRADEAVRDIEGRIRDQRPGGADIRGLGAAFGDDPSSGREHGPDRERGGEYGARGARDLGDRPHGRRQSRRPARSVWAVHGLTHHRTRIAGPRPSARRQVPAQGRPVPTASPAVHPSPVLRPCLPAPEE